MEGDRTDDVSAPPSAAFQSTPSAWRETGISIDGATGSAISIHSLRMEGDCCTGHGRKSCAISIHSLRMEGDSRQNLPVSTVEYFNPLPPHGGRPAAEQTDICRQAISIHSLRMEGDRVSTYVFSDAPHFNPLPPHGGRREIAVLFPAFLLISIHSLRMEGDKSGCRIDIYLHTFQSTPSAWRETDIGRNADLRGVHFNPLPPHGGRQTTVPER